MTPNQPRRGGVESCVSSEVEPFVPISWMGKKQTSVCRMDGIPALDLWDVVIEVLHS